MKEREKKEERRTRKGKKERKRSESDGECVAWAQQEKNKKINN